VLSERTAAEARSVGRTRAARFPELCRSTPFRAIFDKAPVFKRLQTPLSAQYMLSCVEFHNHVPRRPDIARRKDPRVNTGGALLGGKQVSASLLKSLGSIAGVGGIALGVFFLLFRQVISKKIFPMLPPEHAYKLMQSIIRYTFLIAALGLILWWSDGLNVILGNNNRIGG
jgi:hypothetical protein